MIQRMFITLDTKKTNYKNVGKINHGDDLILELTVLSDGDMISFNNPMVDLLVKKSDGKMIRQNSGIEHIKPNKFVIEVMKDCVTSPGLSTNQLIINDNGRISTCMFYYTILNSLEEDIIESISNVEVLEQLDEFTIQIKDKMENFDEELQNRMSELEDAIDDLTEFFGDTSVDLLEAELSRNKAEQSRAQAESIRVQNESRRLQNDLDLANAEAERVRAENVRIQNEADRALVDAIMDQKESKREDSELERIQNESKRITDEAVRQQNENIRQSNESIRMSNETDRKTQENRRATAETNRVNAETTRRNNENSRISNETERQKSIKEMKSLIDNLNGVIEDEINEINSSLDNITNRVEYIENNGAIDGVIEERVSVIEDEIDEINSSLDNITNRITDIENNGGTGVVIASVEPANNDVPKVFFTSSDMLSLNSKNDGEKIVEFEYISKTKTFRSYATVAIQGSTSASFPKKNYTLKLYKDGEKVEKEYINLKGWGNQTKFCLKANYVDTTHTRNLTGARIGYDMVESRPSSAFKTSLQLSPRNGLVDGFPIKVFVNGMFHGIYTWNIPKDTWQFNNPQMVLCAEKNNDGVKTSDDVLMCEFRKLWDGIDGTSWSVESGTLTNTLKDSFNRCVNFVMTSSDEEFKSNISQYFDLYSLLDYYCFSYLCCHLDGLGKNMLMVTYDGVIWGASLYDMDSLFGAWYNGSRFVATDYKCPEEYQENNSLLWQRIETCFAKELYARYKQLRKGALSLGNIVAHVEHIYDLLSERDLSEEKSKWTGLPSIATNTIPRFRSYMQSRAIYVDNEFELFNVEPVPITGLSLGKSNITVNVGNNDTLTVTYIPTNTTQKGVIWESSDTSKATVTNGIVTGVSDGDCIITAKSMFNSNIVATCNVTVEQGSDDTEVIEKSNYLENMNYTVGKLSYDTGQFSTDGSDYVSDFIALNPGVYVFSGKQQKWKGYATYNSSKEFSHFFAYANINDDLIIPILETCYIRTKNDTTTDGVSLSLQTTTFPSYNFKIEDDDVSDFVNGYPNRISHPIVEVRLNPTRITNAVTKREQVSKIEFSDKSIKGFKVDIYQTKVYIQISFPNFTSLAEAQNYLVSNNVTVTIN